MPKDVMVLGAGHSLMLPQLPKGINPQKLNEDFYKFSKVVDTIDSFGLYGSKSYKGYYPDVNSEDLQPSSDEFVEPTFRLLTACIVAKKYNPTDFSTPGVLKKSMSLLKGQTVYCDHQDDIHNAIGSVSEVMWQDEFSQNGVIVPGGINGVLKIDGKSNPRIARGIMMDPPSIHSNSVTVTFEWEPSHTFEDIWDFYYKLGSYDENGELIRKIVTNIINYSETSLVSHGADPFAQKINDKGELNNIEYVNSQYYGAMKNSDEKQDALKRAFYFGDFKSVSTIEEGVSTLHNTAKFNINNTERNKNNLNTNNMTAEELNAFLEGFVGEGKLSLSEGETLDIKSFTEKVTELFKTQAELQKTNSDLTQANQDLTKEVEALKNKSQVTDDKFSEIGKNHISEYREATIASYKKLNPDKVEESIISLLSAESTSLDTLKALKKTYEAQLEEKFPLSCSKCGSKDVSRASTVSNQAQNGGSGVSSTTVADTIANVAHSKLKSK